GSVPNPLSDGCKEIDYSYTLDPTNGIADDGSDRPYLPRLTITRVPANRSLREISRTYFSSDSSGWDETQVCPTPGATWGYAGNLSTVHYYNLQQLNGNNGQLSRAQLYSVSRPDGTASIYEYPDQYTTIEYSGEPDYWPEPGSVLDGTITTTVLAGWSHPVSVTKQDYLSGIIVSSQTDTYTNSTGAYLDPLFRSYIATDLAGLQTQYIYNDCCGLDHVIGPDGTTTYYDYDPNFKRLLGTAKVVSASGGMITTTNVLDGLGRVLASV